jgi:hypothetical protein
VMPAWLAAVIAAVTAIKAIIEKWARPRPVADDKTAATHAIIGDELAVEGEHGVPELVPCRMH